MTDTVPPAYRFAFVATVDDFRASMRVVRGPFLRRVSKHLALFLSMFAGGLAIAWVTGSISGERGPSLAGPFGLWLVGFVLVFPVLLELAMEYVLFPINFSRLGRENRTAVVDIADDAATYRSGHLTVRLPWTSVKRFRDEPERVFIVAGPREFIQIPKRATAEIGTWRSLADYVRTRIHAPA